MGSKHHGSGDFRHHDEQPKENGHEREHCGQHLCRCQSQTDQSSGQKGACHDRHGEQLESEMTDPSQHHEHGHHEHGHHEHGHHEHGHHEHGHHEHGHEGVATAQAGFRRKDAFGAWRANREPGFGRGKVLFFDAFSGVAGDMIVAALVDLGVPQEVVERAVQSLRLPGCELRFQHGYVGSIGALKFDVEVGAGQNERDYATIDRMLLAGELDPAVSSIARTIFRRLAEAEAAVHRTEIDAVHFHEVGAVDSIADIVGAAACIEYIGASVWCSPLPMGRGFIQCRHGKIPLPAPATVQCLSGISTRDAGIEAELVTPTGA
ncbi:MAG: LarC family nickel insertion protein, partial [Myxococcales bacterium]